MKSPGHQKTPGLDMATEVLSAKGNHTHANAPGHIRSPGAKHSPKAKVFSQKFNKIVLHSWFALLIRIKPTVPVGL